MQQLRMPTHERQWSTTLLPLSRSRTPPSRSQHIHSCTLEDRVAARISLLGRGCGALGAERGNKTSERVVSTFCPLLDPPTAMPCLGLVTDFALIRWASRASDGTQGPSGRWSESLTISSFEKISPWLSDTGRLDRRRDGRCMSETPARPVDELGIRVHPEVRRWT